MEPEECPRARCQGCPRCPTARCLRGHLVDPDVLVEFSKMFDWCDRKLRLFIKAENMDRLTKYETCCVEAMTNVSEINTVLDDFPNKFKPLINKWVIEEPELLTLLNTVVELDSTLLHSWISDKMNTGNVGTLREHLTSFLKENGHKEATEWKLGLLDVKACFGPPSGCCNCESRWTDWGSKLRPKAADQILKRCSSCHVVAYCSEKCQKEHWVKNHQKMCKILSNKKMIAPGRHDRNKNCKMCDPSRDPRKHVAQFFSENCEDKDSTVIPCNVEIMQKKLLCNYWEQFGFHRNANCGCNEEAKDVKRRSGNYPMQCPLIMGEISGKYCGWIDEKLAILAQYLNAINEKYKKEIIAHGIRGGLDSLFNLVMSLRAFYWYYVTIERQRFVTEVMISQLIGKWMCLVTVDEGFRKLKTQNVWWETFLHQMADFYRRLRWTHFAMFHADVPQHRMEDFGSFIDVQAYAVLSLRSPLKFMMPSKKSGEQMLTPNFFERLSEGTRCMICGVDLSNKAAVWQLQTAMHQTLNLSGADKVDDVILNRFKGSPVIFEDNNLTAEHRNKPTGLTAPKEPSVSCGNNECNMKAMLMQTDDFMKISKMAINWVFKTHRCHGCLKFCYESHRCSGCRSVRYCSKACLLEDWKVHESSCKEMAGHSEEAGCSVNVRKMDVKERQAYFEECIDFLSEIDHTFAFYAFMWKKDGQGLEEIITTDTKKSKQIRRNNDKKTQGPTARAGKNQNGLMSEAGAASSTIEAEKGKKNNLEKLAEVIKILAEKETQNETDKNSDVNDERKIKNGFTELTNDKMKSGQVDGRKERTETEGKSNKPNGLTAEDGAEETKKLEENSEKIQSVSNKETEEVNETVMEGLYQLTGNGFTKISHKKNAELEAAWRLENSKSEPKKEGQTNREGSKQNGGTVTMIGLSTLVEILKRHDQINNTMEDKTETEMKSGDTMLQPGYSGRTNDSARKVGTCSYCSEETGGSTFCGSIPGSCVGTKNGLTKISNDKKEGIQLKASKEMKEEETTRAGNKPNRLMDEAGAIESKAENERRVVGIKENATLEDNKDGIMSCMKETETEQSESIQELLLRKGFKNIKIASFAVVGKEAKLIHSNDDDLSGKLKTVITEKVNKRDSNVIESKSSRLDPESEELLQKVSKTIYTFRQEVYGKHFEIRHINTHTWMNSRICKLVDVGFKDTKSIFDPRVICTIQGDEEKGKRYSLKVSNMVDICAHQDDMAGQLCQKGTVIRQTKTLLCDNWYKTYALRALSEHDVQKVHQNNRLSSLKDFIVGENTFLKCMDFSDDLPETCMVSASLAAVRPGCIGDGTVNFTKFGQLMCGCPEEEQLDGRFREYLNSGMCHVCQVYYLERQLPEGEKGQYLLGKTFALLTRSPRGPFFGSQSRKCEELGVDRQRYFQFCRLINLCMASQPTKASMTLKAIRAFVKSNRDPSNGVVRKAFSSVQIDACLDMMKEAGLVKLAGCSVLQLKIFSEE